MVERFGEDILAAGLHNGQQVVYVKAAEAAWNWPNLSRQNHSLAMKP